MFYQPPPSPGVDIEVSWQTLKEHLSYLTYHGPASSPLIPNTLTQFIDLRLLDESQNEMLVRA